MEGNQTSTQSISVGALSNIGMVFDSEAVVMPKTKDLFDFSSPVEKITGPAIAQQLEQKANEKPEQSIPVESEDSKKNNKLDLNVLGNLADQLQETIKTTEVSEQSTEGQQSTTQSKEEKAAKNALVSYMKSRIEKGEYQAWNDWDEKKQKLGDYLNGMTNEALEELLDSNVNSQKENIKETYRTEFFESLPKHLQYVVRNLADESADPQAVYAALARLEHVTNLNPTDANDQAGIIRNYLGATQFGTPEEIEAQIEEWKEAETIGKKAAQFKPKLDKIQEDQVRYYAQEAEHAKEQQRQAAQWYTQSVTDALQDKDLNGLKITDKQAKKLYESLLMDVKPSVRNGQPLNGLWQALEKIQVTEPNFKHLAEITWLATDPQGYRDYVIQQGKNQQQEKVTKELKKSQGSTTDLTEDQIPEQRKRGLSKPVNFLDMAAKKAGF